MADKTWVGGTSDDAAVDANWSPSGVPASNDKVTIPDASTTSNDCRLTAATSWGTLGIETNGILVGNGQTLTLNGGVNDGGTAADFNYTDAGQTTNVSGNLDITMRNLRSSGDRAIITAAANNIRNLKIDDFTADGGGTGKVYHFQCHLTISGDLTVEYGELNSAFSSTSYNLTVAGVTTIGDGTGGTPDEATLTCNASTCSFGSGVTADYGILVKANGTFAGGTGTHTAGGFYMDQNAHAKATMTTDVMTINSEKTSANKAWRVEYGGDTFDNANGTVKFHLNGFQTRMSMRGASHANNAFHNLIIDADTSARQISPDNGTKIIVDDDLTITNGKLVMGLSHALEVGGDVEIDDASGTAILEMGASSNISSQAATFGSLTIGGSGTYKATSGTTTLTKDDTSQFIYETISGGTFTHNSGTLTITGDGRVKPRAGTGNFNNVILNASGNTIEQGSDTTIDNDLTITAGEWSTGYSGFGYSNLTVTGDVDVTGTLTGNTSLVELGSLSVASGATYSATSGTTTITKANGGTDGRAFYIHSSATFTHNNGLVKFTASSPQVAPTSSGQTSTSHPFYDLEQTTGTMQWKAEHHKVLNNCTMKGSAFNGSTGNVHVLGICRLTGETFNSGDTATNDNNFFQTLVIESGATVDLSAINITVGSLRNLGGTIQ